nr:uncharacterized protein LOC127348376 [Lolium perenne]
MPPIFKTPSSILLLPPPASLPPLPPPPTSPSPTSPSPTSRAPPMASAEPVLLLPAPASPLLLPAMLPSRSPDSTSRTTVPLFLIRAISSSSPGFRKFLVHLVKQLWGDPKRLGKFLDQWFSPAASRVNPLRVLPIPKAPEFPDIMRLLQALLRKATVQAVLVATATLMVIHLSRARPVEDDDEGALLQRRLPLFVRDGVWRIIAPRGPLPTLRWPPRTWTADAMEALRFDLRRREMDHSDLTLHSGVGQPVMLMAHRDCVEKNSNGNNPR